MNSLKIVFVPLPDGETEAVTYREFVSNLIKKFDDKRLELCHAAMGVSGEAGELCDALKRIAIYGDPEDKHRKNIVEELGDLNFYMEVVQDMFAITDTEILAHNAEKLSKRYAGLMYSDTAAIARADKKEERSPSMHLAHSALYGVPVLLPEKVVCIDTTSPQKPTLEYTHEVSFKINDGDETLYSLNFFSRESADEYAEKVRADGHVEVIVKEIVK